MASFNGCHWENIADFADEIVEKCRIKGLTREDVIEGMTPQKIMEIWLDRSLSGQTRDISEKEENEEAQKHGFPLLPFSQLVFDAMKESPDMENWSFPTLLRLDKEVDILRFTDSVNKSLRNHPALLSVIAEENGQAIQRFRPEKFGEVVFGKPFITPYYTLHLFEENGKNHILFKMNRILGDTAANMNFFADVCRAYMGEELPTDNYYLYLKRFEEKKLTESYSKCKELLTNEFANCPYPLQPTPDVMPDEDIVPIEGTLIEDYSDYEKALGSLQEKNNVSRYEFFCLCVALAIADYCETEGGALTWAYLGRDTQMEQNIFGSLHRDIPLAIEKNSSREDLLRQIKAKMHEGILNSEYPFTLTPPYNERWNYAVNVIEELSIQKEIDESPVRSSLVLDEGETEQVAYALLDVEIHAYEGLFLNFRYSASNYKENSMKRFARLVRKNADWLLEKHHNSTLQLKNLLDNDKELKCLVEKSLQKASENNPDKNTNPVRTLDELYTFLDSFISSMPWESLKSNSYDSLFRQIDQSTGYFLFLFDQPLEELGKSGYFFNCLQYHPKIAEWIRNYNSAWAEHLSAEESWCDEYLEMVSEDESFGLQNGWYESPENWHCWNDFFARKLHSPEARPIGKAEIISPADGIQQQWLNIDSNGNLVIPSDLPLKSACIHSVVDLMGESKYKEAFNGGWFTHTMLDMQDYHRFHAPVDGILKEIRKVDGISGGGGIVIWNKGLGRYTYANLNELGFQMLETRGIAVIETENIGLVGVIPVGMAQVCSINWNDIKVGESIKKGDEMGYFLFGGSDVVLLFQQGAKIEIIEKSINKHLLVGTEIANQLV